jgi:hypothetical protein
VLTTENIRTWGRSGTGSKPCHKLTLRAMDVVRRLQQNPNLGEFRVYAALAQVGIHLSPRILISGLLVLASFALRPRAAEVVESADQEPEE